MLNLTDREWKPFLVGRLFVVKRPKARSEKEYENGNFPFVASGNVNNGVIRCCKPHDDEILDKGNCITVSPVDGSTFYQQSNFLGRGGAGSSILMLYSTKINKYNGIFIARMIRQTCSKYCYGKMGNQDSIKRERILLPISADGEPDYVFMEEFIKEREAVKRKQYLDYCKQQLKIIGGGVYDLIPLADKQWKSFFIIDIFDTIQRGKRLKAADHLAGAIPYVSSSALNNGVDNFISNDKRVRKFFDCLSLANSGSVGSTFYEPFEFVASDHITHLKNGDFNKYHYLFLATMISRLSQKYNFNREINDKRISREIVLLPVTNDGEPDYEYMEKYSRNLLRNKIQSYIDYVAN